MAARIPGLIGLVVGLCLGESPLAAQALADSAGQTRVITGRTLRRSGATRLSELLLLAGGWDAATVDGFTWHASPLGGGPSMPARWIVLVDGRRMDVDLFGNTNLDRLGIPLEQISHVELIDFPRLHAGRLTAEGIVHIHTVSPAPGPSAYGWFTTGSETGDPGPFAFTPDATANVDRSGHDASAGLGYGGDSWFAGVALTSGTVVPTDPAIVERYASILGSRPRLDLTAVSARAGARIGGGRHELTVRRSSAGGAIGLKPFGTEVATRERFADIGMAGRVPAGSQRELSYGVGHGVNRARPRSATLGPTLDWDARTTEAWLELSQTASPLRVAGVRVRRLAVHSPADLDRQAITLATAYAELRLEGGRSDGASAGAAVTVGEGEIGLAAVVTRRWALTRGSRLEAALGYERTVRAEDNSIWAWTERGYGLLADAGATFEEVGSPSAPERVTADARWTARLIPTVTLSARGLYRRARNLSLDHRSLHFVPEISSFEGPAAIVHGAGGDLGGGSVEIGGRVLRRLDFRLSYWFRDVLGGDSLFRETWAAMPRHGARVTVEYAPVPGLDLWMAAGYRGASRWAEFDAVEAESGGRYSPRLADALTIDLAVQKWLWNERLRVHFGVRNLLGDDLRYHPAGATFAPMARVQLEGRVP